MRLRAFLWMVVVLSLIAATGSFAMAWHSSNAPRHLVAFQPTRAPNPPRDSTSTPNDHALQSKRSRFPATAPAPVSVAIPEIGLSARVVPVGIDATGQMQIPAPSLAGWYQRGPAPGAVGGAVLVGHVDNYQGPAVFYRLTGVRAGDRVQVVRADDSRANFIISKVTIVKKTAFPTQEVFGPIATAGIRLITCTGPFDTTTRSYVDSLIAWGYATAS